MAISALDSSNNINAAEISSASDGKLGKNEFLTMLIAQLEHQDPLNPVDGTEFTAQLAQFSSLEELQDINNNIGKLQSLQSSIGNFQAVSYIDRTIEATGNTIQVSDGNTEEILFSLDRDTKSVYINIYDSYGRLVRDLEINSLTSGNQSFRWDGKNNTGDSVADGAYGFEVFATGGVEVPLALFRHAHVGHHRFGTRGGLSGQWNQCAATTRASRPAQDQRRT